MALRKTMLHLIIKRDNLQMIPVRRLVLLEEKLSKYEWVKQEIQENVRTPVSKMQYVKLSNILKYGEGERNMFPPIKIP